MINGRPPRIAFFLGHPAHVLTFSRLILRWAKRGWTIEVAYRNKPMVRELLEARGIPATTLSEPRKQPLVKELPRVWFRALRWFQRMRPDVVLSIAGTFCALPGRLASADVLTLQDTEDARIGNALAFPFSSAVLTPEWYLRSATRRQVAYPSFQELAYSHPDRFVFSQSRLEELGLGANYAVLRFVKHTAGHDIGQQGFGHADRWRLIDRLLESGLNVCLSSEDPVPDAYQKYCRFFAGDDVLQVLAGARVYIGESPTMAMEAGACGTPSAWVSTRVGKLGYIEEMRERFQLVRTYRESAPFFQDLDWLLSDEAQAHWKRQREVLRREKRDLTEWLDEWVCKRLGVPWPGPEQD